MLKLSSMQILIGFSSIEKLKLRNNIGNLPLVIRSPHPLPFLILKITAFQAKDVFSATEFIKNLLEFPKLIPLTLSIQLVSRPFQNFAKHPLRWTGLSFYIRVFSLFSKLLKWHHLWMRTVPIFAPFFLSLYS